MVWHFHLLLDKHIQSFQLCYFVLILQILFLGALLHSPLLQSFKMGLKNMKWIKFWIAEFSMENLNIWSDGKAMELQMIYGCRLKMSLELVASLHNFTGKILMPQHVETTCIR